MKPTFIFPTPPPPPGTISIVVPKATITGTFLTDSDAGQSTLDTFVTVEEISNATSHAGDATTRFFHLMFDEGLLQGPVLALLEGLAIEDGSGFITFYNNLTGATPSLPGGHPPSNPLNMPTFPDNGDPDQGNMDWLDSVVDYLDSASDFYGDNLGPNQTTCFSMIVTTPAGATGTVLSIGIAVGLHTN